jgi:LmbE family N-acetylglucosaminyl deacetylase
MTGGHDMYRPDTPPPRRRLPQLPVKRRVLLLGSAAAASALTATGFVLQDSGADSQKYQMDGPIGDTHMQIVAHPDDDLYFLNPDLRKSIEDGHRTVTVCVTCGEGDGRNGGDSEPQDFESFVAARYNGLRSAHAFMAVKDPLAVWKREQLTLRAGPVAEICTLEEAPRIKMIFLNLWSNAEHSGLAGKRLKQLWSDHSIEHDTLIPNGSPIDKTYTYTRKILLSVLDELLNTFQPIVVRTMDPDPDPQVHDEAHPRFADQEGYSDHEDHTPTGLFAFAALANWWKAGNGRRTVVEAYRGYYGRRWPRNLSDSARELKGDVMDVYAWKDDRDCGDNNGCGDLKITSDGVGTAYGASTIYRYSPDTSWLRCNGDGRLFAVAVRGGRPTRWLEPEGSGTDSAGFEDFGDGLMLPSIGTATVGADVWHSFGIRAGFPSDPKQQARDLMVRTYSFGGAVGQWENLGNPDSGSKNGMHRRSIGMPAAAPMDDGLILVAVRNFDRRVSIRKQRHDDSWSDWKKLDGPIVQDGLSAVTALDGSVELFASGSDGIIWWRESESGWRYETIYTVEPAGPPTVVRLPDDRLLLLLRQADTARLYAYTQLEPDGGWGSDGLSFKAAKGGFGTVAALAPKEWDGRVAIAARNDNGTLSAAVLDTNAVDPHPEWTIDGPVFMHAPALTLDETGRLVAGVLGQDARLHLARQVEPGIGAPVGWRPVTS